MDGSVSLEPAKGKKLPLSTLPATRGRRGLGRRIVWALGEIAGHDSRLWELDGDRLTTWGGAEYNQLLAAILKLAGITDQASGDEYGISGIPDGEEITPARVFGLLAETRKPG